MSYDIQIWSVDPVPMPDALPDAAQWRQEDGAWVYASRNWQLVVGISAKVLFEDVPEDVLGLVPGIGYLTRLNLEPIGAPKRAHTLLGTVSRRLAKASHGVVLDPQTETIEPPTGVKRYRPQRRAERFPTLALSWWFTEGPLLTEAGLRAFIDLLERTLPEALPKRYGLFEPPQHFYAETGKGAFVAFLQQHLNDLVVWYPHRPTLGVYVLASAAWGANPRGFRANYLQIIIEAQTLEQPGWPIALRRFWRAASQAIRPFYGDVRTLHGVLRMGATQGSDRRTDFHPVKSVWWTGIPRTVGHAAVLGAPYLALWPQFERAAQVVDGLAFVSTNDWQTEAEASELAGGVPDAIAQRWVPTWVALPTGGAVINWNTEYPPVWPFDRSEQA